MFTCHSIVAETFWPEPDKADFFRRKQRPKSSLRLSAMAEAKGLSIYTSGFV